MNILQFAVNTSIALLIILGIYLLTRTYLHDQTDNMRLVMFLDIVEMTARGLEQEGKLPGFDGPHKKNLAMVFLRQRADAMKVKISDDEISRYVEATVQEINEEKPFAFLSEEDDRSEG